MTGFFIDFLVLKTGWTDEQVLNNPHFSNKRKFNTYRKMDEFERTLPIAAYPILSEDGNTAVQRGVNTAQEAFFAEIGITRIKMGTAITEKEQELMLSILEQEVGQPMIDIEEILKAKGK